MHLASRSRRLGAFFVDYMALSVLSRLGGAAGKSLALVMSQAHADSIPHLENATYVGGLFGAIFWLGVGVFLNYGVMQGIHGFTLGKLIFGIQVVQGRGRPISIGISLTRAAAYWVSYLPVFLGFAAIFWTRRQRCWHDILCGTVVIERPKRMRPKTKTETLLLEDQRAA